jgi:MSHA biogenesis protein MshK
MKQSQVSSLKFQVGAAAVAAVNFKLQTSNFKLSALILALGAVLALLPAVASAQITTDPTRPPTGFAAEAAEGAAAGNQLQSVMISPTQSAAIINGVRVRLGEKYGDAVLVKVAESEVVLRSGNEQQVLKLYPGVEKREIVPVALVAPALAPAPAAKSAPRKAKAKTRRDAKPPADDDATARQGARP